MQTSFQADYAGSTVPSAETIKETIIEAKMDPSNMSRDDVAAVYMTLGTQAEGERVAIAQEKLDQTVVQFNNNITQTVDNTPRAEAPNPVDTPRVDVGRNNGSNPPNNT